MIRIRLPKDNKEMANDLTANFYVQMHDQFVKEEDKTFAWFVFFDNIQAFESRMKEVGLTWSYIYNSAEKLVTLLTK